MNNLVLIGRATKDVDLRFIPNSGKAVARVSMAVNREFSKEKEADFFNIVAWGKTAEYLEKYLVKGKMFAVHGNLRNNNFEDKNGTKHYSMEVNADRVEILEWPDKDNSQQQNTQQHNNHSNDQGAMSGFQAINSGEDISF